MRSSDGVEALADRLGPLVGDLRLDDERGLVFPQQGSSSWTDAPGVRTALRAPGRVIRGRAGPPSGWISRPTLGAGGRKVAGRGASATPPGDGPSQGLEGPGRLVQLALGGAGLLGPRSASASSSAWTRGSSRQLGVEGAGQQLALAHQHRASRRRARAPRRSGPGSRSCGARMKTQRRPASVRRAVRVDGRGEGVDLRAVGVAHRRDVEQAEASRTGWFSTSRASRIAPGAGAEDRAARAREGARSARRGPSAREALRDRRALAAGQDQGVEAVEVLLARARAPPRRPARSSARAWASTSPWIARMPTARAVTAAPSRAPLTSPGSRAARARRASPSRCPASPRRGRATPSSTSSASSPVRGRAHDRARARAPGPRS